MRWLLIGLLTFAPLSGCAKAPPELSPQAATAFQKTRVIKALDIFRDFAVDLHAADPVKLDERATRKIVLYHQATLRIMQATDTGWVQATTVGLTELVNSLSAEDRAKVAPYVALITAIIQEIGR